MYNIKMLTTAEMSDIISEFPNVKLSYENIMHKKVFNYDIVSAQPNGQKHFAWFTYYNNKNVCFIMEIGKNKEVTNIKIATCCFTSELSHGTILYGTIFRYANNQFFSIEDIFYYKSKTVFHCNWLEKYKLFEKIMKYEIKQVAYNKTFVVFGLPIMSKSIDELQLKIADIKYKITGVQYRCFNRKNVSEIVSLDELKESPKINARNEYQNKENASCNARHTKPPAEHKKTDFQKPSSTYKHVTKREIVFKIKPDIQNDIYHLYASNNGTEIYYDIAYIPDFVTSVMMNKLFRNIKENNNLDALEESDDEEEFENDKEDRFVFLNKSYNMICAYNNKFKKWFPLRVADDNTQIINRHDIPS
jgi:hypothetical protein